MPKRLKVTGPLEEAAFSVGFKPAPARRCVRCQGNEAQLEAEGHLFNFPRVDICTRCWLPADFQIQEEREMLEDLLSSLNDHLFRVEQCIRFYGGKGARP